VYSARRKIAPVKWILVRTSFRRSVAADGSPGPVRAVDLVGSSINAALIGALDL
jgi:hypothetical protein